MSCNACSEALKVGEKDTSYQQETEIRNANLILDSVEGQNKGNSCVKSHVQSIRALVKVALGKSGKPVERRSEYCNRCRTLLQQHIPHIFNDKEQIISFPSLQKLVEWTCGENGEQLRKTDPQLYDEILAAFAWCAREECETRGKREENTNIGNIAKAV